MLRYALRRLLLILPVLLGLSAIVFAIMSLIPGDPARAILGSYATPENLAELRADLGLDLPAPQQYLVWLGNILQGDLGRSYSLNRPVLDEVLERFGATLILAGTSLVICIVVGVAAGIVSAVRQYGWSDKIITLLVLVGISVPAFWLGMLMIMAFAVELLRRLKSEFALTYLFISHDLSVVETISVRIAVMYFGRVIEQAPSRRLFHSPAHPYTRLLLGSAPIPGGLPIQAESGDAELPDPLAPPSGCAFAPPCPRARDDCRESVPPLAPMADRHNQLATCRYPVEGPWRRLAPQAVAEGRE